MDREFERTHGEETLGSVRELTKIGVFSFVKSSGTTFVATSLAKYLAENKRMPVAFIELKHDADCEGLLYDGIGMDRRFASREFKSFYTEIKDRRYIRRRTNMEAGINWGIRTPTDRERDIWLTPLEESRLLNNISGDWIVCDLGSSFYRESLEEMDIIVGVIDPMPSKVIAAKSRFQQMRTEELDGRRLVWVVNKHNAGVNNRLLKKTLKLKSPIVMPLIPEEWFYVAQYHCRLPFEQPEIKKEALPRIEELVNHHILFT